MSLVADLEARVATIEKAIADSIANHNQILTRLDEAKYILGLVTTAANTVAANSPVTATLDSVNTVVDAVVSDVAAPTTVSPEEAIQQSPC